MVSAASNPSFSSIPGCILTITVQPHLPLQKVMHLFPAHVIMTTDDVIPGVIDSNTQDGKSLIVLLKMFLDFLLDILIRPKLSKTITASVDKVCPIMKIISCLLRYPYSAQLSIPLLPSVEEYEMQLLQCLSDDFPANVYDQSLIILISLHPYRV